uniref:EF-hand domain-containing protein n=1 Tax=Lepeophtheirus salmonis TaxID=72036 RepID=A0A0K2SYG6_LEPSM
MRWIRGSSWASFIAWNFSPPIKKYHIPKELRAKGITPPTPPSVNSKIAFMFGSLFLGVSYWIAQVSKRNFQTQKKEERRFKKATARGPRLHFLEFASVEIDGEYYMTPQDFIESMIKNCPSIQICPKLFSSRDAKEINASLPSIRQNGILTSMNEEGILSYEDYLFLFSLLTKSECSFKSAFKLLDQNGNEEIDINEFRTFCQMTTKRIESRDKIRSSLSVLFFGENGTKKLSWKDFTFFLENFQREILSAEFSQYLPRHADKISEKNFAKIILRHSDFTNEIYDEYMTRVNKRIHPVQRQGITFKDFQTFNHLLNHIDDLCIAVRMINFAEIPMDKKQFSRAVNVCLNGETLSDHMIDVIFLIFDIEGDSLLSYDEFLSVAKRMQLRKRRPDYLKKNKYKRFKHCVREELIQDFYGPSEF